ncbi:MAG: AbrB/MazE/SpoVT family DNA-binding domain-containing protein [Alteraurantiacibacter sp.]
MNKTLKITKIGNSAGIILPKEYLEHIQRIIGEDVEVLKTLRGIELKAPDDDFDAQMKVAREIMDKRKRALRELAK